MPKLTNEQKQRYLDSGGTACPHCGSDDLDAYSNSVNVDGGLAWQDVSCLACGKEWRDLYTLTSIEEL